MSRRRSCATRSAASTARGSRPSSRSAPTWRWRASPASPSSGSASRSSPSIPRPIGGRCAATASPTAATATGRYCATTRPRTGGSRSAAATAGRRPPSGFAGGAPNQQLEHAERNQDGRDAEDGKKRGEAAGYGNIRVGLRKGDPVRDREQDRKYGQRDFGHVGYLSGPAAAGCTISLTRC